MKRLFSLVLFTMLITSGLAHGAELRGAYRRLTTSTGCDVSEVAFRGQGVSYTATGSCGITSPAVYYIASVLDPTVNPSQVAANASHSAVSRDASGGLVFLTPVPTYPYLRNLVRFWDPATQLAQTIFPTNYYPDMNVRTLAFDANYAVFPGAEYPDNLYVWDKTGNSVDIFDAPAWDYYSPEISIEGNNAVYRRFMLVDVENPSSAVEYRMHYRDLTDPTVARICDNPLELDSPISPRYSNWGSHAAFTTDNTVVVQDLSTCDEPTLLYSGLETANPSIGQQYLAYNSTTGIRVAQWTPSSVTYSVPASGLTAPKDPVLFGTQLVFVANAVGSSHSDSFLFDFAVPQFDCANPPAGSVLLHRNTASSIGTNTSSYSVSSTYAGKMAVVCLSGDSKFQSLSVDGMKAISKSHQSTTTWKATGYAYPEQNGVISVQLSAAGTEYYELWACPSCTTQLQTR